MLKDENCQWQALCDIAYDQWQEHDKLAPHSEKWGFKEMLENAEGPEKMVAACVLGKLNQQVCNGGFMQWIDNRYAIDSWHCLPEILEEMGPVSKKVLELCKHAMSWVDEDTGYVIEPDGWDREEACDDLDEVDSQFYKLADEWHKEVYAYLAGA